MNEGTVILNFKITWKKTIFLMKRYKKNGGNITIYYLRTKFQIVGLINND